MDVFVTLLILLIAAFSGAAFIVDTTTGILGFTFASIFAIAMLTKRSQGGQAMHETPEEIQRHIMQLEEFLRTTPGIPEEVRRDVQAEIAEYRVRLYRMMKGLSA
jgi:hypothetical protein